MQTVLNLLFTSISILRSESKKQIEDKIMSKDKKAIFKPKAQEVAPIDDKYSQEEVAAAEQLVQNE